MSSGRPRRNAQVDRCFYIYLKIQIPIQIPKPTDKQYGSLWSAYFIPNIMLITIGHQKTPESLFTTLGLIQLT